MINFPPLLALQPPESISIQQQASRPVSIQTRKSCHLFFLSCFIVLLVSLSSLQTLEAAENPENIQKKLNQTQSLLADLQKSLFANKKIEDEHQSRLLELNKEVKLKNSALEKTRQDIKLKEEKLISLEETQKHLNDQLQKQQTLLAKQLKMLYALKQNNELKLLLSLETPQALDRLMNYYPALKASYVNSIQLSSASLEILTKNKTIMAEEKTILSQLMDKQEKQISEIKLLRDKQQGLLQNIQKQMTADQKQLALTRAEEKNLGERLKLLDKSLALSDTPSPAGDSFIRSKGRLRLPIVGPKAEAMKASLPSTSAGNPVMISAEPGQDIRAVYYGRVVFAEQLKGFGLLMIIDHGAGYMSLYGHNQELYKKVGDPVRAGQIIGRVAKAGELGNSSLYFEIRKNGKPINLVGWFK